MSDAPMDAVSVFIRLRAACEKAGGQRSWAAEHEISEQYVCDVLNARTPPGAKILRALGLGRIIRYVELPKVSE